VWTGPREIATFAPRRDLSVAVGDARRGAVPLAAALALPLTTDSGSQFPGLRPHPFRHLRRLLCTLVVQGLTLPWLIRALRVPEDGEEERREELHGRLAIAQAALERIDELSEVEWTNDETIERR
jgi:NhaP-type Na+/H+ or K+/H+ antiporter